MLPVVKVISRRYQIETGARHRRLSVSRVSHPKFAILCYHRVGIEGIPYYCTLKPAVFEMQMRYIRNNFNVISIGQLCEELRNPNGRRQSVAVTFDDGYSDLYTYALPILRKYDIPATVYLTANCIRTGEVAWYDRIFLALQVAPGPVLRLPLPGISELPLGSASQRIETATKIVTVLRRTPAPQKERICASIEEQVVLPSEKLSGRMLSWTQIDQMRSAGIDFGSHTLSHPVLSQLTPPEIVNELRESKKILEERLREPVLDFAYPFGRFEDYGAISPAIAAECGYRSAVTTTWGLNSPGADMHTLRRVQFGEQESEAAFGFHLHVEFLRGESAEPPVKETKGSMKDSDPASLEIHASQRGA
jgi:peptidoglycan/xylan/chitin deacetylase (PgdA/CDA1 family)